MKFKVTDITVADCRAAVAYVDVTGFTGWMTRATVARSDVATFIRKMKTIFREFRFETGYDILTTGDGLIAVTINAGDQQPDMYHLIVHTFRLRARLLAAIRSLNVPRPKDVRIRWTGGFVYRTDEPPLPGCDMRGLDFFGACLNSGKRLLEYRREIAGIITEEGLAMLRRADRKKFVIETIKNIESERAPRGLDPDDIAGLRTIKLRGRLS